MKTINLKLPDARRWSELSPPVCATLVIFFLLLIGLIVGRVRSLPSAAVVPTPALPQPVIIIASPIADGPRPTPAAMVAAQPPIRYVVAFAAPGGAVLGPIPAPPASVVLARYGSAWVLVPWEAGQVWLRAADVGLPDVADLRPTEEPAIAYVASQVEAAPADPPSDWYTDIATPPPGFVESLIGSDPNALACGGSPLCGGLTNAQAQAARDRQRAGQ